MLTFISMTRLADRTNIKRLRNTPYFEFPKWFAKSDCDSKGGTTVVQHCSIAGMVAKELASRRSILCQILPPGFEFIVAVHDCGKGSPGFQKKCCNKDLESICPELASSDIEANGWEVNHSPIGEAAFRAWAKQERQKNAEWLSWSEVIGGHHGVRKNCFREGCGLYGGDEWAKERHLFLDHLFERFGNSLPDSPPTPETKKLLAGLTCVSDWIASNEDFFPNSGNFSESNTPSMVQQAVQECGWTTPEVKQGLRFEDIFDEYQPYPVQKDFANCVDRPGVYVLEAPMGLGKTEAALFAAYKLMAMGHNSGLYFGLPTRLTSDRIYKRVEAFMDRILVEPGFVKLIHGNAWMNLESNASEFKAGMSWFHPRKRALLAPFGVGTVDQALMSVLKVKHHFVRTFGLAGKVVILDEVHSYDAYTGTLLNCLADELLKIGCTVIILSATLTAQRRADFTGRSTLENDYPLISTGDKSIPSPPPPEREIRLEYCGKSPEILIENAVEAAECGLCVLWISNTVAQSQEIYLKIKNECREDSFSVGLLHSRFPTFRRSQIEEDWMESLGKDGRRPIGCILVATQVLIVRSCDDCNTLAELVLCDGTPIMVKAGERDFRKAVSLHQNIVNMPMHPYLKNQKIPPWLSKLVFGVVVVLKIDGEKLKDLSGNETPWGYHENKGVYRRKDNRELPDCYEWENDDEFDC